MVMNVKVKEGKMRALMGALLSFGAAAIIIMTLMIAFTQPSAAQTPSGTADCSQQISADIATVSFPNSQVQLTSQDLQTYNLNVQTVVEINSGNGYTIKNVVFVPQNGQGSAVSILDITPHKVTSNRYTLNFNVKLGQDSNLNEFQTSGIDLSNTILSKIYYVSADAPDTVKCAYAYLTGLKVIFSASIGSNIPIGALPPLARLYKSATDGNITIFGTIDDILKATAAVDAWQCNNDKYKLQDEENKFTANCSRYSEKMISLMKQKDTYDKNVLSPDITSYCESTSPEHKEGCILNVTQCFDDYKNITKMINSTNSVCERVTCHNVVSLDYFSKNVGGDKINDPLKTNFCNSNTGIGTGSSICTQQYLINEQPKCPGVNPIRLSESADSANSGTIVLNDPNSNVCGAKPFTDPVKYVKHTIDGLSNSLQCECIPAIDSYVSFFNQTYNIINECVGGGTDNNASSCTSDLYMFVCDTALNALSCQGVGYGSFTSGPGASYIMNSQGDFLKLDSTTSQQQIYDWINQGYTTQVTAQSHLDTSQLTHAVCQTIFTDQSVDWPGVLARTTGLYSPDTAPTLSYQVLCPVGTKLSSGCNCGLNTNQDNANICDAGKYCTISSSGQYQCVNTASAANPYTPLGDQSTRDSGVKSCTELPGNDGIEVYYYGDDNPRVFHNACSNDASTDSSSQAVYYKYGCNGNNEFTKTPDYSHACPVMA